MINEEKAKNIIESFAEKQTRNHFPCPCCGMDAMDKESVVRNALSRRAKVYVCDWCGITESVEDMEGVPLSLTSWAVVQNLKKFDMEV